MHRDVDAPVAQGFIQFLGEEPFSARILQAPVGDAVAAGDKALDGKIFGTFTADPGKLGPHQMALGQGQRRAARTDLQHHSHSAIGGIEDRMLSTLPPVFRPNMVPRSYRRLNST